MTSTSNHQRPTSNHSQYWALGVAWELEVGSWELS